jgi:hypothetical protein
MENEPLFKIVAAAGLAALILAFASSAHAADATEITRTGTNTTSQGVSGTSSSVTSRSPGGANRQGSWTNAAGGTGTWQSETTWNKDTRTATITGSATKPDGAKTAWQATATRTAPGAVSEKGMITQANGRQSTFTATDSKVASGSWERRETITTADGKTIERNVETSVANGKGSRRVTTTLPDGRTLTRDATFTQTVSPAPTS